MPVEPAQKGIPQEKVQVPSQEPEIFPAQEPAQQSSPDQGQDQGQQQADQGQQGQEYVQQSGSEQTQVPVQYPDEDDTFQGGTQQSQE